MALRLVNSAPGKSKELVKPEQPLHFGMKSTDSSVYLSRIKASMGFSNLVHHGTLPEVDDKLVGAEVRLTAVEELEPAADPPPISLTSEGNLLITKTSANDFERGVYSLLYPIEKDASITGYFRFRRKSWALLKPDWCFLDNMAGLYFGLRHGFYNTSCFAFLQDLGENGRLVVAGPLHSFRTPRPGPSPEDFNWKTTPVDGIIEIWIFVNAIGYPPPFSPEYSPTVEVWARSGAEFKTFGPYPVAAFGNDPMRVADDSATLYFGNVGANGDVLALEDWGLYPDYRLSVLSGRPLPYHSFNILPDAPVTFRPYLRISPVQNAPCRWFSSEGEGFVAPALLDGYQPGRRTVPLALNIVKQDLVTELCTLEREEPRLSPQDGFMFEAFLSGQPEAMDRQCYGGGFAVDDGVHQYRVVMLESEVGRTFGVALLGSATSFSSYLSPDVLIDFSSLHLVRLLVDRVAGMLSLFLDGERVIFSQLSMVSLPSSVYPGTVRIGHVTNVRTQGVVSLALITYLPRLWSYEAGFGHLPSETTGLGFSFDLEGQGGAEVDQGVLTIRKTDFSQFNTRSVFKCPTDLAEEKGCLAEFTARVPYFTNSYGTPFGPSADTGVGLRLNFTNKYLHVGFYDCGIYGRMVGIPTTKVEEDQILSQTPNGKRQSARCDWTEFHTIRVVARAFDKVELWIDSPANDSAIVILWEDLLNGFNLPQLYPQVPPHISFGHFSADESSRSEWLSVRWGTSSGYEGTITQSYRDGQKDYRFGGKVMYRVDFEDSSS